MSAYHLSEGVEACLKCFGNAAKKPPMGDLADCLRLNSIYREY